MVAVADPVVSVQNEPPVCLSQWPENLSRLVSLRAIMQRFQADVFARGSSLIGQAYIHIQLGSMPNQESWKRLVPNLGQLERTCEALGFLPSTLAQIRRIKPYFKTGEGIESVPTITMEAFSRELLDIQLRMNDELEANLFFSIAPDKSAMFQAFGSDHDASNPTKIEESWCPIFTSFPSAKYDSLEALKSYALGRNTASVFHLMRVLEIGLSALGSVFNVSLAHTNWAPAIEKIESEVREMHKHPTWRTIPDCKEQQEFYAQAASHFGVLKDAWRNYTAHARGKYDEQEARDVLVSVRSFMGKLSTRLGE